MEEAAQHPITLDTMWYKQRILLPQADVLWASVSSLRFHMHVVYVDIS